MAFEVQISANRDPQVEARSREAMPISSIAALCTLAILSSTLLIALSYRYIDPRIAALLHVAFVVVVVVGLIARTKRSPSSHTWLGIIATLCAGPFGAIAPILVSGLLSPRRLSIDLNSWFERKSRTSQIGTAEAIASEIANGRSLRPNFNQLRDFRRTVRSGSLAEKQALLGLIGLRYSPEYYGILRMALSSPEASVRVQAAAVFAKLREQFRVHLRDAVGDTDETRIFTNLESIMAAIESGFIDAREERGARKHAKELCHKILAADPTELSAQLWLASLELADEDYESLLMRLKPLVARDVSSIDRRLLGHYTTALRRSGREIEALRTQNAIRQHDPSPTGQSYAGAFLRVATIDSALSGGVGD